MRFNAILTTLISATGITGIQWVDGLHIPELLKFGGQTVIGMLTIVYLYYKIKKVKQ
jgi:hypothetical protein